MKNSTLASTVFLILITLSCHTEKTTTSLETTMMSSWSSAKAFAWQEKYGWLVGCNYTPATAINQLEMWQAETFDAPTIEQELALAASIGFNIVRVYLHDLMWDADSLAFLERMNTFLNIADKHKIKTMFVFFDDCWYGNAQRGKQPEPVPGIHNSGWLQSPTYQAATNPDEFPRLEAYVKGVLKRFKNDERVVLWDLYNEPGNNHLPEQVLPLVKAVFQWARKMNPEQPVTVGIWRKSKEFQEVIDFCLANSDVISFHNYGHYEGMAKDIANLKSYGKPVVCSEYLARGNKSTFETILPLLKKEQVAAINWGFVDGKTQTKYPWNHPLNVIEIEPWHHEIYQKDGTPYRQREVDFIKQLTGKM